MYKFNLHRSVTFAKSTFATLLVVFIIGLSSFTQKGDPIVKTASVKYLGYSGSNSIFQVALDNEAGEKFSVVIKDQYGTTLFSETFQDKKFDKRFVFNKDEGLTKLTFTIRSLKDKGAQTFEINTTTRIVENYDVAITKL